MIKLDNTECQAIVITDKYDRVVCIIDTDGVGAMVVEKKGYHANFIDSKDTDFDYRVYGQDDIRIVNKKEKYLS